MSDLHPIPGFYICTCSNEAFGVFAGDVIGYEPGQPASAILHRTIDHYDIDSVLSSPCIIRVSSLDEAFRVALASRCLPPPGPRAPVVRRLRLDA